MKRKAEDQTASSIGPRDACIVGAARTPMGSLAGALKGVAAPALGAVAITAALERAAVPAEAVEEVIMGNVLSANVGQAPARQAALQAGIPEAVPATTVNKVCASGMKAIMFAAQAIMCGQRDVVVAGGMENMSATPYYQPAMREGARLGHVQSVDGVIKDGLWDATTDQHMGNCAEVCAATHGFSREEQDAFALTSYRRAQAAQAAGKFAAEIAPVTLPGRRGKPDTVVGADEEAGKFPDMQMESLSRLRPCFQPGDGTVTAGNASPISDGASAVVMVSGAKAAELGLTVLAVVRAFDDAATAPVEFTTAPALAVPRALARAGLTAADVDAFELNEAFSVVGLANTRLLGLSPDKVNLYGGAVALGHPLGSSGCRIVVTLLSVLAQEGGRVGCAAVCNGGGGASALVLERSSL